MPTPTGLPKAGEVWERQPFDTRLEPQRFVVLKRGTGSYWSLRVAYRKDGRYVRDLWVDPAYALSRGMLKFIGPAGPKTKKELGLG